MSFGTFFIDQLALHQKLEDVGQSGKILLQLAAESHNPQATDVVTMLLEKGVPPILLPNSTEARETLKKAQEQLENKRSYSMN